MEEGEAWRLILFFVPFQPKLRSWRHRIRRHHWQHKPPGDLGQYRFDTATAIPNVLCSQAWHRLGPLELRNLGSMIHRSCLWDKQEVVLLGREIGE